MNASKANLSFGSNQCADQKIAAGIIAALMPFAAFGPASAQNSFCQRLEAKMASPAASRSDARQLEMRLRQAIRRAAAEGCDPQGGLFSDGYCVGQVAQIRRLSKAIRGGERRNGHPERLRAIYKNAGCDRRPDSAVSKPYKQAAKRQSARQRPTQPEAFIQPIVESFVPVSRAVGKLAANLPEPLAPVSVKPNFDPAEYARLREPRPLPEDRQNVRVVGPIFLPEPDSGMAFSTIARSEPGIAERIIHRAVAILGNGFTPTRAADLQIDAMETASVD